MSAKKRVQVQRKNRRLWVWAVVALALAVLIYTGLQLWHPNAAAGLSSLPGTPTTTPRPLLDFTVQDLGGKPVALSAYRGQVVLVNFWATWCPPCKEELPLLDMYYQEYRQQGFVLLAVNVSDRPPEAQAFVQERGYTFPVLFDPPGDMLVKLRVSGLPVSLLVDDQGYLQRAWVGPLTPEDLDNYVTPLLR